MDSKLCQIFVSSYGFFAMQLNDPAIGQKNVKLIVRITVCGHDSKTQRAIFILDTKFRDQPLNFSNRARNSGIGHSIGESATKFWHRTINSGIAERNPVYTLFPGPCSDFLQFAGIRECELDHCAGRQVQFCQFALKVIW